MTCAYFNGIGAKPPGGYQWPWWEGTKAFGHELFVNQLYGGCRALVTGEAGHALGERSVQMVENRTGRNFTGTAGDWGRFAQGMGGDLTGISGITEGISGYDLATYEGLGTGERWQRGVSGASAFAGTAAGGLATGSRVAGYAGGAGRAGGVARSGGRVATNSFEDIAAFRLRAGLQPFAADSGDTVARVIVNGRAYHGVNSTITEASKIASKPLRQRWQREIDWVPPKARTPRHLGHAQPLAHAYSHALMRAFERQKLLVVS